MTMDDPKDQTAAWAQEAMERLKLDGLAPIPDNFAVYYSYFSGSNGNLKMAMDLLLDKFGKLDQALCNNLFQAYLSLEAEHKVLDTTTTNIEDELKRVMSVLSNTTAETNQYGQTLNIFSGTLKSTVSLDQIRAAVTHVASETRVMAEQNQRLHTQLALSTQQLSEVRYNLDQVKKDSLLDPLTEVGNRKYFENELARITLEAIENETPLAALMVDIDHFKKFNDAYGHLIGDQVLRLVAHTLIENLKGRDVIARYGGEEFVILLPQTRVVDAERVGNLLRTALGTKQVRRKNTNETLGTVTISIGATEYCPYEDPEAFVARADAAMYDAKQAGRNRVMSRVLSPEEIAAIQAKNAAKT
jgi:diguanylate cyclase